MPRTAITPQRAVSSGLALATEAANVDGNSIGSDPRRVLVVINGSAAAITATLVTPGSADGDLAIPDRAVSVPAGATRYIGGLGASVYRQSDGTVHVNYSAVATVTVAVLESS